MIYRVVKLVTTLRPNLDFFLALPPPPDQEQWACNQDSRLQPALPPGLWTSGGTGKQLRRQRTGTSCGWAGRGPGHQRNYTLHTSAEPVEDLG